MSNHSERGSVTRLPNPSDDNAIVRQALEILEARSRMPEWYVQNAEDVKQYLRLLLAAEHGRECMFVLFLDARDGVIDTDLLYQGGFDLGTFKSRVVVQHALACNATGVVFVHNQTDGGEAWGRTDQYLLSRLINALGLVDITVRDYFLMSNEVGIYSFYEHGRV